MLRSCGEERWVPGGDQSGAPGVGRRRPPPPSGRCSHRSGTESRCTGGSRWAGDASCWRVRRPPGRYGGARRRRGRRSWRGRAPSSGRRARPRASSPRRSGRGGPAECPRPLCRLGRAPPSQAASPRRTTRPDAQARARRLRASAPARRSEQPLAGQSCGARLNHSASERLASSLPWARRAGAVNPRCGSNATGPGGPAVTSEVALVAVGGEPAARRGSLGL